MKSLNTDLKRDTQYHPFTQHFHYIDTTSRTNFKSREYRETEKSFKNIFA